jgi:hypothetical protein
MEGADRQIIRREGEYWTIEFDGALFRLRDARGLHHLAYLLSHPHENVSCLVLERMEHLHTLPPELHPSSDAPKDARERARVNVTRAIAAVLRRIAEHHPTLGAHLSATIRTGTFCSYRPDPRLPVRWRD